MLQCQSFNDSLLKYNFMTCYSLGFLFPGRFIKSRTYIINDTPHIKNIVMNCYNATFNDTQCLNVCGTSICAMGDPCTYYGRLTLIFHKKHKMGGFFTPGDM